MTMVVVRLSNTALKKKVTTQISYINVVNFFVLICELIFSKPSWASITSTMVMAPIKKKMIPAVEPMVSLN